MISYLDSEHLACFFAGSELLRFFWSSPPSLPFVELRCAAAAHAGVQGAGWGAVILLVSRRAAGDGGRGKGAGLGLERERELAIVVTRTGKSSAPAAPQLFSQSMQSAPPSNQSKPSAALAPASSSAEFSEIVRFSEVWHERVRKTKNCFLWRSRNLSSHFSNLMGKVY